MNVVRAIAGRFGSIRALARALDLPQSTVQYWAKVDRISGQDLQDMLAAGQALDPPLTPDDFFEPQEEPDAAKERSRRDAAD